MTDPSPAGKRRREGEGVLQLGAVRIPAANLGGRGLGINGGAGTSDDDETMMMPPHEIVARRESRESSPMATTFSCSKEREDFGRGGI
ncbi:uncharacterized protein A4U43_C09F830 [Asparagus officinalis]|uniref:Uncharacterized protein n=1 Tax=Asparagus officinalis TaxID=4686 RepID=A0A5P1E4R9_ASPOF|nr:uncharacterized protein A4U43_C09F830 [Asparagus officinalis]